MCFQRKKSYLKLNSQVLQSEVIIILKDRSGFHVIFPPPMKSAYSMCHGANLCDYFWRIVLCLLIQRLYYNLQLCHTSLRTNGSCNQSLLTCPLETGIKLCLG